jgi:preprotein translocase subunit SecG
MSGIMIALLVVGIVVGVIFLAEDKVKDVSCESYGQGDYYWTGSQCQESATNTTAVATDMISNIDDIFSYATLIVSLIGLLILILMFQPIIKGAMGFGKNMGGQY